MSKSENLFQLTAIKINKVLLTPIKSIRKRYVPLLLIYFAYWASGFSSIALSFWQKENLSLTTEQLISIWIWVMIPWTLKMVFWQMVDCVPIAWSKRKAYIFIGAFFMILWSVLLAWLAGKYEAIIWIGNEYTIYLLSSLFSTLGFVIQDVTADTMSTEVVEREIVLPDWTKLARSEQDIQADLTIIQVLWRLSLSLAIFSVAYLWWYLAEILKYETIFWMTLIIPFISCIAVIFIKLDINPLSKPVPINYKILGWWLIFAIFSVFMAILDFEFSQEIVFVVSLCLISSMFYFITKDVWKEKLKILTFTLIALFLFRATPWVWPWLSWFLIDELEFNPEFFWILGQIWSFTAILILWLFSDLISNKPIRNVLIFLIIAETIIFMPELWIYYLWTNWIIWPEWAKTIALFDTALESPLVNISMVPMLALIAYYAPENNRWTWFAIWASLMNLALTAWSLITKYLNKIFIVSREIKNQAGEIITQADYSQLWELMIAKIVISFLLPLFAIIIFLKKPPRKSKIGRIEKQISAILPEQAPIKARMKKNFE